MNAREFFQVKGFNDASKQYKSGSTLQNKLKASFLKAKSSLLRSCFFSPSGAFYSSYSYYTFKF